VDKSINFIKHSQKIFSKRRRLFIENIGELLTQAHAKNKYYDEQYKNELVVKRIWDKTSNEVMENLGDGCDINVIRIKNYFLLNQATEFGLIVEKYCSEFQIKKLGTIVNKLEMECVKMQKFMDDEQNLIEKRRKQRDHGFYVFMIETMEAIEKQSSANKIVSKRTTT
jgi:hypothetical protein